MSESVIIDPTRQAELAAIIRRLHAGESAAVVRKDFARLIEGVTAPEIAAMEQALIDEGMAVEEVQRLCDVHVEVFRGELSKGAKSHGLPGHPVHSYLAENREAKSRLARLLGEARALSWGLGDPAASRSSLEDLRRFIVHYERKENQLFPWLERKGFTGPSKVMWGKHDEIRAQFKAAFSALEACELDARIGAEAKTRRRDARTFRAEARALGGRMRRMMFMEERILIPNALARLDERDWAEIRRGEDAIGFAWIEPGAVWDPAFAGGAKGPGTEGRAPSLSELVAHAEAGKYDDLPSSTRDAPGASGDEGGGGKEGANLVDLRVGTLPAAVVDLILRNLPLDLSFVDAKDRVAWYSDGAHRVFPRSPGVIGRDVRNCHPPKSLATVENILRAFREGSRDSARFWIELGGRFVVIEYFAVRDAEGRYLGTLEASQDATEIRSLSGQRRLLDWE